MNVAQPIPYTAEGPQPLVREITQGEAYPVEALGALSGAVKAVQRATQAPVAIAAQSALSIASLAVQGHADVEGLLGSHPTSLFCLTVAQSGERKSGCDKLLMRGVKDVEEAQWADYWDAVSSHDLAAKVWTAKRDRLVKEASGSKAKDVTAAEADLRGLGPEPSAPMSPKRTTAEPTLEGLFKLYQIGQPSLGLFSDEGGGFLGGHAMNSDNKLKTVAGLSSLWGGEALDRVRAGDGASTLYGRRLSIHLMVQPIAARGLLADPIALGQGFLARFLMTEPPSAIGTRMADTGHEIGAAEIDATYRRVGQLLSEELPTKEDRPRELSPRVLPLSPDARALLLRYYQATEKEQAAGGQYEMVRSFASKSPEQAARIAGVLTLWANLNAPQITLEAMTNAIELANFYLNEAKRLAEASVISAETDRAETLRRWLLESWPTIAHNNDQDPHAIVPSDVVRYGPGPIRESSIVKRLMVLLESNGWLARLDDGAVIDGKARRLSYRIIRGQT